MAQQSVPFAEIVIVDDASTESVAGLARSYGCRVISMERKSGFAHAVNCGCNAAQTDWVAILNSDVELDRNWLERLLDAAGADTGFATGMILSASNHAIIDGTYDLVSRGACAWRAGHGEPRPVPPGTCRPIAIAPATACLFRRTVLDRLGGFDESYISYLEDIDLGLRFVREGIQGVYVPDAVAYHHGSASSGQWSAATVRLISRNQLLLVARHYDKVLFRACFWSILMGQLLWGMVAARHGRPLAWLAGKIEGLREFRIQGVPSQRLRAFLISSEIEIRARAQDPYWLWYFRLTGAH